MARKLRPELSKDNPWYLSKDRYYELKHFCLQYKEWQEELNSISYLKSPSLIFDRIDRSTTSDPVHDYVTHKLELEEKINIVKKAATLTDEYLSPYLLKAVTEGYSYNYLRTTLNIPYSRDVYYSLYRKFFWILSQLHT